MSFVLNNDVFFAALYEGHVAHEAARKWLDEIKPEGWAISIETQTFTSSDSNDGFPMLTVKDVLNYTISLKN